MRHLAQYLRSEPQTDETKREIEGLLRRAVELGDVDSMLELAKDGGVCEADAEEAYQYWYRAAKRGDERAFYGLAECYMKGLGTEEDAQEGLEMLHAAADAGDDRALYRIGRLFENEGNQDKAAECYIHAIEAGNAVAGAALMRMLLLG